MGRRSTVATERENSRVRDQDGSSLQGERKDETGRFLFWARRPFGYNGEDLDRGQILPLTGARNDEKLVRLGYVLMLRATDQLFPCRKCKAQFVDLNTLNAHGDKRHLEREHEPSVPFSPRGATVDETAAEAEEFEREQSVADKEAPLNFDKTEASRRD